MDTLSETGNSIAVDAGLETRQQLFEQTWNDICAQSRPPRWDRYLPASGKSCTPEFVQSLVQIDIQFRIKAGLPALLAEPYFDHPRLKEPDAALSDPQKLEIIRWEYQHRWKRGDRVSRRVYQERFPDLATAIESLRPRWNCSACNKLGIALGEESDEQTACPNCKTSFDVASLFAVTAPDRTQGFSGDSSASLPSRWLCEETVGVTGFRAARDTSKCPHPNHLPSKPALGKRPQVNPICMSPKNGFRICSRIRPKRLR